MPCRNISHIIVLKIRAALRFILIVILIATFVSCQKASEKRKQLLELERIHKDSVKSAPNPYKLGQGTQTYDAERSALGNLDSAATPPSPAIPQH